MFGLGMPELILILIIGLVVFGPGKLPDIGKAVGKSLNEFKKATSSPVETDKTEQRANAVTKTEPAKLEPPKEEVK